MAESAYSLRRVVKKVIGGCLLFAALAFAGFFLWGHGLVSSAFEWAGACLLFLAFNRSLPDLHIAWKHALPGALAGGTIWTLSKWGFTAWLQRLTKANQIYAIFGVLPLFLLWLYFTIATLLLSACFNSALANRRSAS
jgi:membrane protein